MKLFRDSKPQYWIWYALLSIIGLYTHYFFIFVLLTEGIFYLVYRKRFPKYALPKFIIVATVSLASLTPWLLYVRSLGTASNTQPYLETPSSGDLFNTYAQFIFGFQVDHLNTIIISLWPIIVLVAFFNLQKKNKTPPEAIFLIAAALLPVIATFIISVTFRPVYESRYLIVALPALLILLAWMISLYPKKIRRASQIILVTLVIALLFIQTASPNTPIKEDYKAAVSYLTHNTSSQDIVVATAPFTIYPIEYYYKGPAKLTTQPIWNRFEQGSIPAFNKQILEKETTENVSAYQHAWLVLSYDQGYNAQMKSYYDSHFERLLEKEFSPGLVVYEYKIRYDPPILLTR